MKLPAQVVVETNDRGEAACASCGCWDRKLRAFVLAVDDTGWEPVCALCWRAIAAAGVMSLADRQNRF